MKTCTSKIPYGIYIYLYFNNLMFIEIPVFDAITYGSEIEGKELREEQQKEVEEIGLQLILSIFLFLVRAQGVVCLVARDEKTRDKKMA